LAAEVDSGDRSNRGDACSRAESAIELPGKPEMEDPVNEEAFNLSIRKFLKMVGIGSQREIEQAVAKAIGDGSIAGTEAFPAKGH
jgi:hypothetical protein